jgi:Fe-S-cluster-containing dehydrogenase component
MSKQVGFYYNQNYCIGCQACETACKVKNKLAPGIRWRSVDHFETKANGRQVDRYLSRACMHCEKPACVRVCPVKAFSKRPADGIVIQNHEKCVGCRACVYACPYKAIAFSQREIKASKCDLCLDNRQQGEAPACVRGCPLQVLQAGEISRMDKEGAAGECRGFSRNATGPAMRFPPEKRPAHD